MEDQGKRLLIAVAIAFGIMLAWMLLFPQSKDDEEEVAETPGAAEVTDGKPAPGAPPAPGTPEPAGAVTPEAAAPGTVPPAPPREAEVEVPFDTPRFRAVFSNWGGGIKSWTLHGAKFEDRATGGDAQSDLADTGGGGRVAVEVGFDAIENTPSHAIPADAVWRMIEKTDSGIAYQWSDADLEVTKVFELVPDKYLVKATVTAKKLSATPVKQAMRVTTYHRQDPDTVKEGSLSQVSRQWRAGCYTGGEPDTNSYDYLLKKGPRRYQGKVRWGGFTHSYFLHGIAVKDDSADDQSRCDLSSLRDAPAGTMRTDIVLGPPKALEGVGKIYQRSFAVYLGPKYLDMLEEIDGAAGFETDFEHSVDLGWFAFIARPMLWLLKMFQGWVGNWGLAIIMLTLVVKLLTLYWTHKSMKSMRAMAKLKPQMEEIQKKYKDDRQRQQQEIMAMYKANKVNPLSGCLPMLLQMPIWFALYRALNVAAELYQAPFIPGWIDDLTLPDPYYALPILLMVMMFVQARITPSSGDSAQQKMMQYGLPLVFGVFGFFFPAGLTLYIFTNTLLSALHGVYMRKTDPMPVATAVAGAAPAAAASGKPAGEPASKPAAPPVARSAAPAGGQKKGGGGGGGGKRKKDRRS